MFELLTVRHAARIQSRHTVRSIPHGERLSEQRPLLRTTRRRRRNVWRCDGSDDACTAPAVLPRVSKPTPPVFSPGTSLNVCLNAIRVAVSLSNVNATQRVQWLQSLVANAIPFAETGASTTFCADGLLLTSTFIQVGADTSGYVHSHDTRVRPSQWLMGTLREVDNRRNLR